MARTKRVAAAAPKSVKQKAIQKDIEDIKEQIQDIEQRFLQALESKFLQSLLHIPSDFANIRTKVPSKMLQMTMGDIINGEINDSQLSDTTILSNITNTLDSTNNTTRTVKKTPHTRSSSSSSAQDLNKTKVVRKGRPRRSKSAVCNDEGYTTSESSSASTFSERPSARQSRARARNAGNKDSAVKPSRFRTPVNKQIPPTNGGTITPKCKPNTPLMYVRRPKIGEIGWSNQGSPLLVSGTVAPESVPNINIPVGDDILSMMPLRGLVRESQIPDMDDDTRKHLEILRDNLIKMCETMKK